MGYFIKSLIFIFLFIQEMYTEVPRATDFCIVRTPTAIVTSTPNFTCINDVTNLDNINILKFTNSNLPTLPELAFSSFPRITKLYLNGCGVLSILQNAFAKNSKLEELYLNDNHLTGLLQLGSFNNLENLRILDLSRNYLASLDSHIFDNLRHLQILNLSCNNLGDISDLEYVNTVDVRILDYSHNSLTILDSKLFSKFNKLQKLLLNNNKISRLVLDHHNRYSKLEFVDASFNQINYIHTPDFIEFKISNNPLNLNINFGDDVTDISKNNIPSFTISSPNAKFINASWNSITALTNVFFWKARDLNVIDLSHNAIKVIDSDTFDTLEVLMHLNLSDNQLIGLKYGTFDKFVNLETVDLSNNKFHYLYEAPHEGVFGFCNLVHLREVNLQGNPWSRSILNRMYIFKQISSELNQLGGTTEAVVVDYSIEDVLELLSTSTERIGYMGTSHSLNSGSNSKKLEIIIFVTYLLYFGCILISTIR